MSNPPPSPPNSPPPAAPLRITNELAVEWWAPILFLVFFGFLHYKVVGQLSAKLFEYVYGKDELENKQALKVWSQIILVQFVSAVALCLFWILYLVGVVESGTGAAKYTEAEAAEIPAAVEGQHKPLVYDAFWATWGPALLASMSFTGFLWVAVIRYQVTKSERTASTMQPVIRIFGATLLVIYSVLFAHGAIVFNLLYAVGACVYALVYFWDMVSANFAVASLMEGDLEGCHAGITAWATFLGWSAIALGAILNTIGDVMIEKHRDNPYLKPYSTDDFRLLAYAQVVLPIIGSVALMGVSVMYLCFAKPKAVKAAALGLVTGDSTQNAPILPKGAAEPVDAGRHVFGTVEIA